jgi:hypothetical protein
VLVFPDLFTHTASIHMCTYNNCAYRCGPAGFESWLCLRFVALG